jgi:hypothetical protein
MIEDLKESTTVVNIKNSEYDVLIARPSKWEILTPILKTRKH